MRLKDAARQFLGTIGLLEAVRSFRRRMTPVPRVPSGEEKRRIIDQYRQRFGTTVFVETGTFLGDTVAAMAPKCERLFSIELSEELAARAQKRFAGESKVTILHGDSGERLAEVLREIGAPALFWLDGHYSMDFTYQGEFFRTARGELETPVMKELQCVLASNLAHVILIDDARIFKGTNDYPTVREVTEFVKARRPDYKVSVRDDIIRIVPRVG